MAWPVRLTRMATLYLAVLSTVAIVCIFYFNSQQLGSTSSWQAVWAKSSALAVEGSWSHAKMDSTTSFLKALQNYHVNGHDEPSLSSLPSEPTGEVTVLLQILTKGQIKPAVLDAMLEQTLPIHSLWIVCPTIIQSSVQAYADTHVKNIRVIAADVPAQLHPDGSAGSLQGIWLHVLGEVTTDWVWVIDVEARPGPDYLKTIWRLQQTQEYRGALLGTVATILPPNMDKTEPAQILCLPEAQEHLHKVTQPVDMVHGSWLLRKQWLPALMADTRPQSLSLPLAYYVSRNLIRYSSVPSVYVPITSLQQTITTNHCDDIWRAYKNNMSWARLRSLKTSPTAVDRRQRSMNEDQKLVLFVIDGPEEVTSLRPLICRFPSAHVVVTGGHRGLSGKSLLKAFNIIGCGDIIVHDIDVLPTLDPNSAVTAMVFEIEKVIDTLRPHAVINLQRDEPLYYALQHLLTLQDGTAFIGIPRNDIPHSLWISDLAPDALQQWNTISIQLVVITDRRPHSLSRLLESSKHAFYFGDKVDLVIQMEQTADRVTRMLVSSFPWIQGTKTVRHRINKGGLMPAVVESWYPSNDHEYAVLLEDDIEVSPLFYSWAKYNILKYRYTENQKKAAKRLFGISLYSPRNTELHPEGRRIFNPNNAISNPETPYVSQVPCSWGAVYFPEHWREFHQYLTARMDDLNNGRKYVITVPFSRSERWSKSWKKYIIELVYLRAYVMLYPNFKEFESFSTNHLEFGTHVTAGRQAVDLFRVPLMQHDTILSQLSNGRLPDFDNLPVLDLWGDLQSIDILESLANQWHETVSSCARTAGTFDPSDILCEQPEKQKAIIAAVAVANIIRKPKKPKEAKPKEGVQQDEGAQPKKKVAKPKKTVKKLEHLKYIIDQIRPGDDIYSPLHLWPGTIDVASLDTLPSNELIEDEYMSDLAEDLEAVNNLD